MIKTFNKNFEQYITMYTDDLQYMAGEAYGWGDKEVSGLVYGLFTQARRIVISLASPGGFDTSNQAAQCSMDPDYTTWLNEYMLDNYGHGCVGNWHGHGAIQMDHSSDGDVNQIQRLAGRENLETMVQLVLTRQKATNMNQKLIGFSNIKEKLLDGARLCILVPSGSKRLTSSLSDQSLACSKSFPQSIGRYRYSGYTRQTSLRAISFRENNL